MKKTILIAGATGNLGMRIIQALQGTGAEIRAVVRKSSNATTVQQLEQLGVHVFKVDMKNVAEVKGACEGATCVVSALAGLRDVILDTQKVVLDAAVAAGVPRFIPSDYSLDFTKFSQGENRNLDLRREFHVYLDQQPIAATSIFNGAFMDMLTKEMPMILFDKKKILYWGNADHRMVFTTIADVAVFTAQAALDDNTPRYLRIAGEQVSPKEMQTVVSAVMGEPFGTFRPGGSGLLGMIIKIARTFSPAPNDLYPAWQGMQYMHNMIDERSNQATLDNDRYPMSWTKVKDVLEAFKQSRSAS
jgi:nucleoside-diphosphate-sugar epimerase